MKIEVELVKKDMTKKKHDFNTDNMTINEFKKVYRNIIGEKEFNNLSKIIIKEIV